MDPQAIAGAVAGADAVISALGPPGRGPTSILTDSTPSIITAMNDAGTTRLITISGSMVDDTGDGPLLRYIAKPITRRILKNACADMISAENAIHASQLDWTILRPPRLTDTAAAGKWRTALNRNVPHGPDRARAPTWVDRQPNAEDDQSVERKPAPAPGHLSQRRIVHQLYTDSRS
jgi:hypothetical protein